MKLTHSYFRVCTTFMDIIKKQFRMPKLPPPALEENSAVKSRDPLPVKA